MTSDMIQVPTHLIQFKDAEGNWHCVPVAYQTAYEAYVAFCDAQVPKINPITLEAFYNTFNILANSDFINTLVNSNTESFLPIAAGGTGASDVVTARANLQVPSIAEVDAVVTAHYNALDSALQNLNSKVDVADNNLKDRLDEVEKQAGALPDKIDLATVDISYGPDAPSDTTPGTIYFRFYNT